MGTSISCSEDGQQTTVSAHIQELSAKASKLDALSSRCTPQNAKQNKAVYSFIMAHTANLIKDSYFENDDFKKQILNEKETTILNKYYFLLSSATKENIVRGLARAFKLIGIEVDENDSLECIAKSLRSELDHFTDCLNIDDTIHESICKIIANILNDEFTPNVCKEDKLIDDTIGMISICRQILELTYALVMGIFTEFIEVLHEIFDKNIEISMTKALVLAYDEIKSTAYNIEDSHIFTVNPMFLQGSVLANGIKKAIWNLITVATISAQVDAVFKTIDIEKLT